MSRANVAFTSGVLLTLLAMGILSGCYSYAPLQGAPSPGDQVRARLSLEASVRRSRMLGEQIDAVSGEVQSVDGDGAISLLMPLDRTMEQRARRQSFTQSITLSRDDVEALEIRRLSKVRSAILGVSIAAIASVAVQRTVTGGSEGTGGGGDGTGVSLVVDLLPFLVGGR